MKLQALAPGKINLCLFLGGVRDDGRHELVTVFESVSLADELVVSTGGDRDDVVCPGVEGPNLVSRALEGLRARGWDAPPVRVEILKRVPVAAGMGGGSADAAAALRLARQLGRINDGIVAELATELGADVPSQLVPGLALGTGAGEIVAPLQALEPHAVLILPQPGPLSTPEVFREADRLGLARSSEDLRDKHEELVALRPGARIPDQLLVNDLAPAAVSLCPEIADALQNLRAAGAENAIVCGSGPTVAGLYWGAGAADRAGAAAAELAGRYPGATSAVPVGTEP